VGSEPPKFFKKKSFWSYRILKLTLRGVLAGHIAAMVTYCATKLSTTYSAIIGYNFDTMSLASTNVQWF